jgi:hypothetical protein
MRLPSKVNILILFRIRDNITKGIVQVVGLKYSECQAEVMHTVKNAVLKIRVVVIKEERMIF